MFNGLTSADWTLTLESTSEKQASLPYAVETSGLTVVRGRTVVLRDVDLTLSSGEIMALKGVNGAGKTTLLHCLVGALKPTQGRILWFGEPAVRTPNARRRVGFLGHESGLYLALTASENLLFAGRMHGVEYAAERADRLLTVTGLQQYRRRQVGQLSRGQRQRLAIARAVVHDPAILLLDEPFTSLDAAGRRWLRGFLQQRRENGCAILIASHDIDDELIDRTAVLEKRPWWA